MFGASKIGLDNEQNRMQWVEKTLLRIPRGSRILDAGAGEGKYKKFCGHLEYLSQDFCQYNGAGDKRGLQADKWDTSQINIISDITSIPEGDKSFDALMCVEVFEHLPEPIKAIREFHRLLKPQGYLILTAPFCSLTHFAPYHFYSGFSRYFYEKHLREAGFEILEMEQNGNWFSYMAQEMRRMPWCAEHYAQHTVSIFTRVVIRINLLLLERIERTGKGSAEFFCHGYHVFARKI